MKKSPMKNMAYWKGKNSTPAKQMNVAGVVMDATKKLDPNATIQEKIDAKIDEKVDEVVNNKTGEGLV
jgi:hypothetical protein